MHFLLRENSHHSDFLELYFALGTSIAHSGSHVRILRDKTTSKRRSDSSCHERMRQDTAKERRHAQTQGRALREKGAKRAGSLPHTKSNSATKAHTNTTGTNTHMHIHPENFFDRACGLPIFSGSQEDKRRDRIERWIYWIDGDTTKHKLNTVCKDSCE
jgi:hypothetical protein